MNDIIKTDNDAWTKKAMAFVTRSHRHLWGKNNEAPLSFLFQRGLKNEFAKKMLVGWNKFGQNRPIKNWGLEAQTFEDTALFFPAGLVIPYIIDKQLTGIIFYPLDDEYDQLVLPGSSAATMHLGSDPTRILVVRDVMDGLYLFQQMGDTCSVRICPSSDIGPDRIRPDDFNKDARITLCIKKSAGATPENNGVEENRKIRYFFYNAYNDLNEL